MKQGDWLIPLDHEYKWIAQVVRCEREGSALEPGPWWAATNTRLQDGSWAIRNDGNAIIRAESYMRLYEVEDGIFMVHGLEPRLRLDEAAAHVAPGESFELFC